MLLFLSAKKISICYNHYEYNNKENIMKKSICGADCDSCQMNTSCKGCVKTKGKPFGGDCVVAKCCQSKGQKVCNSCDNDCNLKDRLIAEFNKLKIANCPKVKELFSLNGSFVNMEYLLANGTTCKLLDDNAIYLGNQLPKQGTNRCYGLATDAKYLLVCEYGENGVDPEIIVYKKLDI